MHKAVNNDFGTWRIFTDRYIESARSSPSTFPKSDRFGSTFAVVAGEMVEGYDIDWKAIRWREAATGKLSQKKLTLHSACFHRESRFHLLFGNRVATIEEFSVFPAPATR